MYLKPWRFNHLILTLLHINKLRRVIGRFELLYHPKLSLVVLSFSTFVPNTPSHRSSSPVSGSVTSVWSFASYLFSEGWRGIFGYIHSFLRNIYNNYHLLLTTLQVPNLEVLWVKEFLLIWKKIQRKRNTVSLNLYQISLFMNYNCRITFSSYRKINFVTKLPKKDYLSWSQMNVDLEVVVFSL